MESLPIDFRVGEKKYSSTITIGRESYAVLPIPGVGRRFTEVADPEKSSADSQVQYEMFYPLSLILDATSFTNSGTLYTFADKGTQFKGSVVVSDGKVSNFQFNYQSTSKPAGTRYTESESYRYSYDVKVGPIVAPPKTTIYPVLHPPLPQ
jgi:hypothetical protein